MGQTSGKDSMADSARLTELEIALTHQERVAEELSEIIRAQAGRLDLVERALAGLAERLAELESRDTSPPAAGARPPHW
jgi:SlyX protein